MTARSFQLRRPAVVSMTDGPFVPEHADLDEVRRRWEALCAGNPAYFDGRVSHVLGVHRNGHGGAVVHAADCAFRFYAVQDDGFDLGVRPLGVKGVTMRGGRVLVGRRSQQVAGYPGAWELAPGGVVEPGRTPAEVVAAELEEETGLTVAREPVPVSVMLDPVVRTWEIVFRVEPGPGDPVAEPTEYDELRWCAPEDVPEPMTPIAVRILQHGAR